MTTITVRSVSTGKYHRSTQGSNTLWCNYSGQRRMPRFSPARCEDVARAGEQMFCKKCFPNGKPKE